MFRNHKTPNRNNHFWPNIHLPIHNNGSDQEKGATEPGGSSKLLTLTKFTFAMSSIHFLCPLSLHVLFSKICHEKGLRKSSY